MRYKKEDTQLYKRILPSGLSVYYYRVYTPEGKRLRISTGKSKKFEAKNYVNKLIEEGTLIPDNKKITLFSEFTENFWLWDKCQYVRRKREFGKGLSKEYVQIQRLNLAKHILPFFGKREIGSITKSDIDAWLLTFKDKNLSNQTAKNNLNTLNVIFREAYNKELINKNPTLKIDKIETKNKERQILKDEEFFKLFSSNALEEIWNNDILCYVGNMLPALTGLRQGEVLAIRGKNVFPDYINIENSFSKIEGLKSPKTKATRIVPIPKILYEWLLKLKKESPDLYLFSFKGDKPIGGRKLTEGLYKALNKIGLSTEKIKERNITFHSWRHFFNTLLMRNNIAINKIQNVIGHKTDEMTKHYNHFELKDYEDILLIQEGLLRIE